MSNILFITHTRIGDAVLSSGILRHLVEAYPSARFTIACGPLAASLFDAVPRREATVIVTKRPFDGHWFTLWRKLKGTRWELVVDLRRSLVSYFLAAQTRRVLGPADDSVHRVRYLSSVLGNGGPFGPHLYTAPHHHDRARMLIGEGAPVLAIAPFAATNAKTWPQARFAELVTRLVSPGGQCQGWRVALFGGPEDASRAAPLIAQLATPPLAVFGEPDLLAVHAALGLCAAFVGNDSGLGHLAACAGVPTLALFGPMDPGRYAPWGDHCAALRAPEGVMDHLESATVADAFSALLARNSRAA